MKDTHKYYILPYLTENDYKNKKSEFKGLTGFWDETSKEQNRLFNKGKYYAVCIHAVKDNRQVSILL